MLRLIMPILLAALIAFIGGGASVHYALRHFNGFHKVQIGAWAAYPQEENGEAEPYAQAKSGRHTENSLGRAEGLSFYLNRDEEGNPLSGRCRYILRGQVPEAQFFTLYAIDKDRAPLAAAKNSGLPDKLFSQDIIRDESGAVTVILAAKAASGNWLAVPSAPYGLQLNLYDTPITAMSGLAKPSMPRVVKIKEGRCG